jgi:hypothetical protein
MLQLFLPNLNALDPHVGGLHEVHAHE